MKILITGAAGFIGSHLMSKLNSDYEVEGIDLLNVNNIASVKRAQHFKNVKQASIHSDFISFFKEKPSILIHLAAETGIAGSLNNPSLYFKQNIEGTMNVLEECRKNKIQYLIYASSSSVYEPNHSTMTEQSPHNHQLSYYGTSKRISEVMIENYCKQFGITAIGLRFFTVYGSWTRPDMAAYKFMTAVDKEKAIILYNDGNVSRDFTHISDVVQAIELIIKRIQEQPKGQHRIFNIGYGQPVSVKKYATTIAHYLNKPLKIISAPLPINELKSTHSDCTQLENFIDFKPLCSLEEGIKEMTDWFKVFRY